MKEKKLKLKTNLEKTRVKKLRDLCGQEIEEPKEKGRKDAKNEAGGQRYDPSSSNERGSGERTLSTTKRQRRKQQKQQKQKLKDNPAILKAEQKFGGRKTR